MLGAIVGGIAEAYYKDIPPEILRRVRKRLSRDLWEKALHFYQRHGIPGIRNTRRILL